MPPVSGLMVRAATTHLALGFSLGAITLVVKATGQPSPLWSLRETHIHVLLFGWLFQFAAGVALAILPRLPAGPPRGDERLAWLAFGALNIGVVSGGLAPLAAGSAANFQFMAGLGYLVAVGSFARAIWARVRTVNPVWPTDFPVSRGPG